MTYASASDVAALTKNLVSGASVYATSTSPTLSQVNVWLMTGCAVINTRLAVLGYDAIPVTSAAYGLAQQAEACYGAWMAERSRTNPRTGDEESTRAAMFRSDFEFLMKQLEGAIDRLGVPFLSRASTARVYAGGISRSDKSSRESDSDRVSPRFARGQFDNPESLRPDSVTSAS